MLARFSTAKAGHSRAGIEREADFDCAGAHKLRHVEEALAALYARSRQAHAAERAGAVLRPFPEFGGAMVSHQAAFRERAANCRFILSSNARMRSPWRAVITRAATGLPQPLARFFAGELSRFITPPSLSEFRRGARLMPARAQSRARLARRSSAANRAGDFSCRPSEFWALCLRAPRDAR